MNSGGDDFWFSCLALAFSYIKTTRTWVYNLWLVELIGSLELEIELKHIIYIS